MYNRPLYRIADQADGGRMRGHPVALYAEYLKVLELTNGAIKVVLLVS